MAVKRGTDRYRSGLLYLPLEPGDVVEVVPGQLVGQLLHHVPENDRVDVLPQHVEQEPVSHFAPPDDQVDRVLPDQTVAHPEQVHPHPRREYYYYPVDDGHESQHAEYYEPEPEEYVDLLVDDVQGQDAHGVVLLELTGNAELAEGALGHPREYLDHGVGPVLLVAVDEREHFYSVHQEGAVEEPVHQEHLAWKVEICL